MNFQNQNDFLFHRSKVNTQRFDDKEQFKSLVMDNCERYILVFICLYFTFLPLIFGKIFASNLSKFANAESLMYTFL